MYYDRAITCLKECPSCGDNDQCNGQPALDFDPVQSHPFRGPVCDWPANNVCGVTCDTEKDEYECCKNDDCSCPGAYCSLNFHCVDNDC